MHAARAKQSVPAGQIVVLPVITGTMVKLSDSFTFPALEDDNPAPVAVQFTCGFGGAADVPANLKLAVKVLAATWYESRASEAGEALPMGVEVLIAPYRWVTV